jgi:2-hydroxychromene-2-carboxylate isomerase
MAVRTQRYYFSFRSPYSWLAHEELLRLHPARAAALEWIPFWEPDEGMTAELANAGGTFVYAAMSRAKHFYILQDVRRLCAERGLPMRWPVDRAPHWEVPHLAYLAAARQGAGERFAAAVFRARWHEGRDICRPETVRELAGEVGLDPAELAGAATDAELRAAGLAALLKVSRDGVFGVPFFVSGHDKYWGLDRLAAFLAAGGDGWQAPAAAGGPDLVEVMAEPGHAGGCG